MRGPAGGACPPADEEADEVREVSPPAQETVRRSTDV